jgi:type II secretion system protein N
VATALEVIARHPLLRRIALPALFAVAFIVFLPLTFPFEPLARRIEVEARSAGTEITLGKLGPSGFFGLRAHDVRVKLPPPPGGEAPPELKLDRVDLSPDLLPLLLRKTSFSFAAAGYGGTVSGHAALSKAQTLASLRITASDLDLHALPLKDLAGIDLAGKLQLKVDLPALEPIDVANGAISFSVKGAALTTGNVQGFTLPRTGLGDLDGAVLVEKGTAKVEKCAARGGDVDADVDGNVHLRPLLSLSQADLHVRFKMGDKWLNENGMIKGALGLISNARQGDGSYVFTFAGPLSRMNPRPGR